MRTTKTQRKLALVTKRTVVSYQALTETIMNPILRLLDRDLILLEAALREDYSAAGSPFGRNGKGFGIWIEYCQATTVN
jgi:hypothetical protein